MLFTTLPYPLRAIRARLIAAVIVIIVGAGSAAAQKVSYDFSMEQGTYQELQGATSVPMPLGDTLTERYNVGLGGETFNFFRRPYTLSDSSGIQISSMGYIRVENDTSMVIIDGIFGSLVPRDGTSGISYLIDGEPGERIVKAQWKNAAFLTGGTENFTNFQIWLHQKSGLIEIRMGEGYAPRLDTLGAWMGTFIAPHSFQYMIEKLWIAGRPSKFVLDSSRTIFFQILKELPQSGSIIRLTPRGTSSSVEGNVEEKLDLRLTIDDLRLEEKKDFRCPAGTRDTWQRCSIQGQGCSIQRQGCSIQG
jgi:hypothetical protein